jgi:signal transduction histidine kinase
VPESFTGDKTKIRQILVNLLSNAVKFTNDGNISLKVDIDTMEGIFKAINNIFGLTKSWAVSQNFIRFSVKDTGVGVNPKDFGKIFSAFEQVLSFVHERSN